MFNLGSFKLFSSESISKDLTPSDYAKTEKRLKELSSYLGLHSKQSWPLQLTSRVIPSSTSSTTTNSTLSTGLNHHQNLNTHHHHASSQQYHSTFTNGSVERIVSIHWNDLYKSLVIVLSNGLIASCFFHPSYLNSINHLYLDKYLMGKIKTEYMVDFIFDNRMILISYTNPRVTCILIDESKRNKAWMTRKRKLFKLKSQNVKIIEHELNVNCGRRVERHLLRSEIKNDDEDLLLVWWQNGSNTVCPWSSPITSSKDFCNILIYNLIRDSFDLVGYASILNDILKICFCKRRVNRLMTIESDSDPCFILFREYQVNMIDECYILEMVESIQLTVPCQVVKADVNFELNKVCLLCEDRSVLIYNIDQNSIRFFQAPINAINLINSPFDSYFILADSFGQIMMYDYGLHVMPANYDDLFLREAFTGLSEMKFLNNSLICLRFTDDPNLMIITLPPNLDYIGLIRSYVKHDYINEAIENVQLLNWNFNSYFAYSSLNIIFNHLLRTPLNIIKESQLQETLASFFIPKIPIAEDIIEEYQYEMHCIAKRFFYHLYRYSCLEKAFLLALDLKSRHLFLLLHKIAKERGNEKLADVSLSNAYKFNNSSGPSSNVNNNAIIDSKQYKDDSSHQTINNYQEANDQKKLYGHRQNYQNSSLNQNNQPRDSLHSYNGSPLLISESSITNNHGNEIQSLYQLPQKPLTTFKPVRHQKESSSSSSSDDAIIPTYSSPRKRSGLATNKLSKSNVNNGKVIGNQLNYNSATYGYNDGQTTIKQMDDSQVNLGCSTNAQKSYLPINNDTLDSHQQSTLPTHRLLSTQNERPSMRPPPLPPKAKNKYNIIARKSLTNIGKNEMSHFTVDPTENPVSSPALRNIINYPVNNNPSPSVIGNNSHSIVDEPIFRTDDANLQNNRTENGQNEQRNVPLQINYLMKSQINNENAKIECIHYGLV